VIIFFNIVPHVSEFTTSNGTSTVGDVTVALWQLTVALFVAGGAVGSLGSSWICEKLGRRNGNMVNQIPAILCGALSFAAKYANAPELLMVGRFCVGLTAGAGCTYVPVYLTEIAPTQYRSLF
jgi:MFS family permease